MKLRIIFIIHFDIIDYSMLKIAKESSKSFSLLFLSFLFSIITIIKFPLHNISNNFQFYTDTISLTELIHFLSFLFIGYIFFLCKKKKNIKMFCQNCIPHQIGIAPHTTFFNSCFLVTRKKRKGKMFIDVSTMPSSTCSISFRNGKMKDCCKYSISYTLSYDGEPIQRGRWFYPYRFQTRLTNTDIGRYEINIGEGTVSATRLKPEGREKRNTAKYPICEGISLSLPLPLSLSFSLSPCTLWSIDFVIQTWRLASRSNARDRTL